MNAAQAKFETVYGGSEGIEARLASAGAPGLSLAVTMRGTPLFAAAYGVAEAGRPLTMGMAFQAASLSKPVAAALALLLVEGGKLELDAPLTERLAGWPHALDPRARRVTLRRLLSHSAGLTVDGFTGYAAPPLPTIEQSIAGAPPANHGPVTIDADPGAERRYSGGGYLLLQWLIERTLDRPFGEIATELLLRPLGMADSVFRAGLPSARHWARGHDKSGVMLPNGARLHPELAAAGLWSTPSDLARFTLAVQAAAAGRVSPIPARAAKLMLTPQIGGFSLAFHVDGPPKARRFRHTGSNAGYRCELRGRAGGEKAGAVVMVNGEPRAGFIGEVLTVLDTALGLQLGGAKE